MPDGPDRPAPKPLEIIAAHSHVVACDGGGGVLGHPKVYLRIVAREVMCPYCSRLYVLDADAAADPGH
ncbi:MAG TPA: zinc-finger domain-containing protein [Acetobacteraceae bacterium]|jgi:uncharacterized Zn-finger protein|nr:zinc-finger domain-containing protein [Acetobacteraceae bacterium]